MGGRGFGSFWAGEMLRYSKSPEEHTDSPSGDRVAGSFQRIATRVGPHVGRCFRTRNASLPVPSPTPTYRLVWGQSGCRVQCRHANRMHSGPSDWQKFGGGRGVAQRRILAACQSSNGATTHNLSPCSANTSIGAGSSPHRHGLLRYVSMPDFAQLHHWGQFGIEPVSGSFSTSINRLLTSSKLSDSSPGCRSSNSPCADKTSVSPANTGGCVVAGCVGNHQ